jgi:predicted LPLAT superfamily acyltransferase
MEHWSRKRERGGGAWQLRLMLALYRRLGTRGIRAILYPVVFFFFLSPSLRRESFRFLVRISALRSEPAPRARDVFRHLFSFAFSLVEKIAAWSRDMGLERLALKTPDAGGLAELLAGGSGAFVICSHLGNTEMLRALANTEVSRILPRFGITSIVDFSGTARFNRLLEEVNPDSMVRLVSALDMGPDTIIVLRERIAAGELVVIAGDRTPARGGSGGVSEVGFLGEPAYFPQGAFVLASLMDAPVYFMFAVREDDGRFDSPYGFYVWRARTDVTGSRRERRAKIRALTEEFAGHLGTLCLAHPFQWYNFFDFWTKPGAAEPIPAGAASGGP